MRTRWIVFGLITSVLGAVTLAVAFGALGFFPVPVHALLGSIGGTGFSLGSCALFYEWKDRR